MSGNEHSPANDSAPAHLLDDEAKADLDARLEKATKKGRQRADAKRLPSRPARARAAAAGSEVKTVEAAADAAVETAHSPLAKPEKTRQSQEAPGPDREVEQGRYGKPREEDLPLTPEQKEALFAALPRSRKSVAELLRDVATESVAHLQPQQSQSKDDLRKDREAPMLRAVAASLPEEYAIRLQLLDEATRLSRNELVARVLSAIDSYLATHEPEENQQIQDPVDRRKDLVRQKRELAEEVSGIFERLGLTLCCPSGTPGNLRVYANQKNTKGEYRLTPRGSSQAEVSRVNLRDMLSSMRFEGTTSSLESSKTHVSGQAFQPHRDKIDNLENPLDGADLSP